MSVALGTVQVDSGQPPPIPIHVEEYSSSPLVWEVAVGTFHVPLMLLNSLPPCSIEPWLYPNQFVDWFALTATIVPLWVDAAFAGVATRASTRHALSARAIRAT